MTFELTAKSTRGSHHGRAAAALAPDASVFKLDRARRDALLGALDLYEIDSRETLRVLMPAPKGPDGKPVLGSGYQLIRLVGQGGVGEIWRARQHSLQREIAVKKLRLAPPGGASLRASEQERLSRAAFVQEALIAGSLAHPNVIPVYDLGVDEEGGPLLAMKLVEGRVWASVLEEDRAKPERLRRHLEVLLQVCNAVAFAHSRHVVHRDLKPAQVMLGEYGEVLLMDWGLAIDGRSREELREGERTIAPLREEACAPAGTPVYMAPEQTFDHAEHVSERTDIYLLGGILFEVLTGNPPHAARTVDEALALARRGEIVRYPESLHGYRPPDELMVVAMRALAPEPENRYGSVLEFSAAVEAFLAGESRREESRKLTRQAREEYEEMSAGDYMELARIDADLTRALVLWPDNREASTLRQSVLREYAAAAVSSGDLKLADLLGLHFDNEEDLRDLREQISLAVRQKARTEHGRRLRALATAAVIGALLVGGWWLATVALRLRDDARTREQLALRSAGKIVESLARGMDRPFLGSTRSRVDMVNEALAIYEELGRSLPASPDLLAGTSEAYLAVHDAYRSLGIKPAASARLSEARTAAERAVALDPAPRYQRLLAEVLLREAQWRADNGGPDDALRFVEQARAPIALLRAASLHEPTLVALHLELERAAALIEGRIHLALDRLDLALPLYNRSVEFAQRLADHAASAGDGVADGSGLVQSLAQLATTYERMDDRSNAGTALRELVATAERRFDARRDDPRARRDLVEAYLSLHDYLAAAGRASEALRLLDDAVLRAREGADDAPDDLLASYQLAATLLRAAAARAAAGAPEAALAEADEALARLDALLAAAPADVAVRLTKADALGRLADLHDRLGDLPPAYDAAGRATTLLEQLLIERPADPAIMARLGHALADRARLAVAADRADEAHACHVRWSEVEPRFLEASPERARAEIAAIETTIRFVAAWDAAPLAARRTRQLPLMQRLADMRTALRERGAAVAADLEALQPRFAELDVAIRKLTEGVDPQAEPTAPPPPPAAP